MSGQNPHLGDMRHGQIPVGCPSPHHPPPPPPPPRLTLIGALRRYALEQPPGSLWQQSVGLRLLLYLTCQKQIKDTVLGPSAFKRAARRGMFAFFFSRNHTLYSRNRWPSCNQVRATSYRATGKYEGRGGKFICESSRYSSIANWTETPTKD